MSKIVVKPNKVSDIKSLLKYDIDGIILPIKNLSVESSFFMSIEEVINIKTDKEKIVLINKIMHNNDLEELSNVLNKIKTSKRYENIIISNFKNVRNNDTQFGAMSVRFNDNLLIAFKGSDSSLISWIENLRLNYQYPTYTQSKGIKIINDLNFIS